MPDICVLATAVAAHPHPHAVSQSRAKVDKMHLSCGYFHYRKYPCVLTRRGGMAYQIHLKLHVLGMWREALTEPGL